MQIGILEPNLFSEKAISILSEIAEVKLYSHQMSLPEFLADKEVIFVRLNYMLDAELLKSASELKYICSPTTGLNHIETEFAKAKGIEIISLKGDVDFLQTIRATPEHTFGLALALLRNYKAIISAGDDLVWNRELFRGSELCDSTVGIVGFGRVGKQLAKYLECFGANVRIIDSDSMQYKQIGSATSVATSIEDLITTSTLIFNCASFNGEVIFDSKIIDLMRGKFFINTARGEMIDENHLIARIVEKYFAGVALDVVADEQREGNKKKLLELTKHTNLIVTPHIGGATTTSMWKTENRIVEKLLATFNGGK